MSTKSVHALWSDVSNKRKHFGEQQTFLGNIKRRKYFGRGKVTKRRLFVREGCKKRPFYTEMSKSAELLYGLIRGQKGPKMALKCTKKIN